MHNTLLRALVVATVHLGAGTVGIYALGLALLTRSATNRSTSPVASATMRLGAYVSFAAAAAVIAFGVSILLNKG